MDDAAGGRLAPEIDHPPSLAQFLVDLEGWQGKKPEGFSMEMFGTNKITVTREYERGHAHL